MLHVTQANPVHLAYLMLGGFVVAFSSVAMLIKDRLFIGEVVFGTIFGIIIGPHCAGIFDPHSWGSFAIQNTITLEFMRIVLVTGLFAVIPTMAFGWLVIGGIIKALFPSLAYVSALVIAACLTPTDPVLAAAIIGGRFADKSVPAHLSHLLSAESATNDGLAYPFLSISIYLAVETSKRAAFGKWFLIGWLYQVILGTVLGAVIGRAFAHALKISHRMGFINQESFIAQYLALATFTMGVASSLGVDDLLAAFAAGNAMSWDGRFKTHIEGQVFASVIDLVFNCACFIYIGAWMPFGKFGDVDLGLEPWRLVVLLIAILTIRRFPSMLLLYKFVPDVKNWREALFCGHFGPMGVGAIFVSTLAMSELPSPKELPTNQNELLAAVIHPIISFTVFGSIIIHGLSIPGFLFFKSSLEKLSLLRPGQAIENVENGAAILESTSPTIVDQSGNVQK